MKLVLKPDDKRSILIASIVVLFLYVAARIVQAYIHRQSVM
jgi:hypothetical protein